MSETTHKVAQLRRSLLPLEEPHRFVRTPLGHGPADGCLGGGLARGALHEVFAGGGHGIAAIGFAAALAMRLSAKKPLLWIRQDFAALEYGDVAGSGVLETGFDPGRLVLLRVADAKDGLKAVADALSCASLGAVLLELSGAAKLLDLTASRRLTLACAHKSVTAILLRLDAKAEASAAETRWLVRGAPSPPLQENWGAPRFDAALMRNRHGVLGHWLMEWDCEHGHFCHPADAARSGAVVETAFDRQDRTQTPPLRRAG